MPTKGPAIRIYRILLTAATIFLLSPLLLYWFIHGSYDRYTWIIHQPYPFSAFGGGPFQLFMAICGVIIGMLLFTVAWMIKRHYRSVRN